VTGRNYLFGEFRLDVAGKVLYRDDHRVPLTPKAIETLVALVENHGEVVHKDELLRCIWPDTFVEEISLTRNISVLRKVLSNGAGGQPFIETISKRGYRFVSAVRSVTEPAARSEAPTDARPAAPRAMLAVLPFENLSGGKKHDYFSEGVTEEMITQLARISPERLGVIARTSAMQYRSTDKTIRQIGEELGVSHVLEGSIRRAGKRVRIAAQLIQVSDETHLWAQSYERHLGDILALQSVVAQAVAKEIQVKLVPEKHAGAVSADAVNLQVNPQVYEAYLKGRYLLNFRTLDALQKSVLYFKRALQQDPRYAAALAGVADAYLILLDTGHLPTREATKKARAAAGKALRIEETLAEACTSLGHSYFHEFNWVAAQKEFRRAIDLNPNYANAHLYYSNYLIAVGKPEEAIAEARHALALDPVSLPTATNLASILYYAGDYQEAAQQSLKVLEIDRTFYRGYEDLGRIYEEQGLHDQAVTALESAVVYSDRSSRPLASLAYACALAGKRRESLKLLQELKQASKTRYVSPFGFAVIFAGLGNKDEAFAWLAKAFAQRDSALPFLKVNPRLAPLRSDRRFYKLMQRVGLSQ
jgi:TolB-like protein/Tfp pilus assembly protein PilF